jgi:hypothetical protein
MEGRCAELSESAGEPLGATATTADRWLLLEVPGTWPRDIGDEGPLPEEAHHAISTWARETPRSRVQFIRRPGRTGKRLLAFSIVSEESRSEVRRVELRSHLDLAGLDFEAMGEHVHGSLVLVCGHGSRDQCCARRGTAVYNALSDRLGEEELWISSHQGGHRFAANLLVLPRGLQFGRVEPDEAPLVAARAVAGRIELGHYRGRTCYEPAVQAAELAVRVVTGFEGVADVSLESIEDSTVTFRTYGGVQRSARVERSDGPSVPASCGADSEPQPVLRAVVL